MARCDRCGEEEAMPYQCGLCGGTYCSSHRLPENHDCPGLDTWNDPDGVFDSGFDDSVATAGGRDASAADRVARRLPFETGTGSVFSYFRENMTFVFLGLMWVTFGLQYLIAPIAGVEVGSSDWYHLFTLNSHHPEYVWTWVTSVFSHGGLTHIFLNSIVLYFFGPPVERRMGSRAFAAFFLITGAIAGLAQVGAAIALDPGILGEPLFAVPNGSAVLGASGAIAAVMGVLTVLNPNLRIYIYFIIPMPLWLATTLFAGFAVLSSGVGGIGAGNVAQIAHLAGLVVGLGYGLKLKREGERAPPQLQLGGGRGPGGPGGGRGRI